MMDDLIARRDNAVLTYLDRHLDAGHGCRTCFRSEDGDVTYGGLAQLSGRAASVLTDAGVRIEDRVMLVLPDTPLLVAFMLGAMRIGALPVPVSTRLLAVDYAYVAADCRPSAFVVGAEQTDVLQLAFKAPPSPPVVFTVPSVTGALDKASPSQGVAPTSRDDAALIQYTSGTTGTPKGVVHLHRGLIALPEGFGRRLELGPDDVCFSASKIPFGYGTGNSILFPMAAGASSILHPGPTDPFSVVDLLQRFEPTVFFAVPGLYSALLSLSDEAIVKPIQRLRLCVSGGEHVNQTLRDRWRDRFGAEILDGFGSTECLHIFMTSTPRFSGGESVGELVDGVEARLLDDADVPVATGDIGHLWIKSPTNAARYWNKHSETTATMHGPWTRTGDQLFQDADGYFHYVGRSDDILKVGGMKVAPTEVEAALLQHPAVAECAVVGKLEDGVTTTVVAYVCVNDGYQNTPNLERELHRHARSTLAVHKRPRAFHIVTTLPTTSTGKLARFRLRTPAAES
jgi:benzoate-CoA ligase family protein